LRGLNVAAEDFVSPAWHLAKMPSAQSQRREKLEVAALERRKHREGADKEPKSRNILWPAKKQSLVGREVRQAV
jgi:hypothetical protein